MFKQISIMKVLRNIFIVLISTGWLIPLYGGIDTFLSWLYHAHQPDYEKELDCGLGIELSSGFIGIGLLWLGIVVAFWAFVATNKLWPIKKTNQP